MRLVAQLSVPVRRFVRSESAGAGLMVAATVVALLWANSPWGASYEALWNTELSIRLGQRVIAQDLRQWVNDGLMVFFFFLVGMEMRRELSMGELTHRNRLTVPAIAALAGLAVPALIYLAFNAGGPGAAGWGIPISTDTAFVLGVLALAGSRLPTQLRVFLLSLSVVDDIGALTVIAVFYSEDIDVFALAIAGLCVLVFLTLARLRVWRGPAYFAVGVVMWLAMYASGVHPTIGGVVLGLLVSAYPPRRTEVEQAGLLTQAFRQSPQVDLARQAKLSVERAVSPNERIGALLVPWSSYVVVPIFAFANAGVRLDDALLARAVRSPITIGVLTGLVVGKFLGVGLASTLAVKLRLGALSPGLGLADLWGGAALCGIGFTVSLFVADLAFDDPVLREEATVGVLAASVVAAALGSLLLQVVVRLRGDVEQPTRLVPPVDPSRDHIRGPVDAPLTVVEFGGFECPFCGRATGVVEELRERFGDELRYVFRHLPLPDVHPHAELAAEAAEAAGAQGAFWAMHDRLFAHQDELTATDLVDHAAALGLDLERFARVLGDGTYGDRVRADVVSAEASGATSSPTFFVNGIRHTGPTTADELAAALIRTDPRGDGRRPPPPPPPEPPAPTPPRTVSPPVVLPPVDQLEETPDEFGAFARLSPDQIAVLQRAGRRRSIRRGDVLLRSGADEFDFIVVLAGKVAIVEPAQGDGEPHISGVHGPGRFLGGLNQLAGQRPIRSVVALEPGEVLMLPLDRLRAVLARHRDIADLVNRTFLLRRALLIGRASGLRVVGDRRWPASRELRAALVEHGIDHQWLDPADDDLARTVLREAASDDGAVEQPVVVTPDGQLLVGPPLEEVQRVADAYRRV